MLQADLRIGNIDIRCLFDVRLPPIDADGHSCNRCEWIHPALGAFHFDRAWTHRDLTHLVSICRLSQYCRYNRYCFDECSLQTKTHTRWVYANHFSAE